VCIGTGEPPADAGSTTADACIASTYSEAVLASAPVVYYRMDDDQFPLTDSSTGGHPGTIDSAANVVFQAPGGVVGDADTAMSFHGPDYDQVLFGDIDWSGDYTIELLVRPVIVTNIGGALFFSDRYLVNGLRFGLADGRLKLWCSESGCSDAELFSTAVVSFGTWHHIALTRQGVHYQAFLDGALAIDGTLPTFIEPEPGGRFGPGSGWDMDGDYDECAVYDHVLTAAEIARHAALAHDGPSCP
jgi:hypothetical protein